MVNCEELIGTTEYLTLYRRCRINRCRYNRVRLSFTMFHLTKKVGFVILREILSRDVLNHFSFPPLCSDVTPNPRFLTEKGI
jgi:hypothetical protein